MEAEQIAEWSAKHPGERILDIDLPLSYGIIDPVRDSCNLNMITFKWDPTRDTGLYIKVNCISTEFTPKKHGGEKGVPFRLQVESFDPDDNRLHAAGCVIQVSRLSRYFLSSETGELSITFATIFFIPILKYFTTFKTNGK